MPPARYTAFAFLDGKVKEMVAAVERAGLATQKANVSGHAIPVVERLSSSRILTEGASSHDGCSRADLPGA